MPRLARGVIAAVAAVAAGTWLAGCGAQLGGGAFVDSHGTWRGAGTVDLRIVQMRGSGPVLGVHVPVAFESADRPFVLRAAVLEMGTHLRGPGPLALELLYDFGLGGPVARSYRGAGVYFGGAAALLLRVAGDADWRAVFATAFLDVDLVLTARVGGWLAPARTNDWITGEGSAELAVRFTFGSDLFSTQHWNEGS